MHLAKPATVVILLAALPGAAAAEEWRYCLAPAQASHKVYLSDPFPTNAPMESLEAAFGRSLNQIGAGYDSIQCPRADSQTALSAMQQAAIGFNRDRGNKAVKLDWRPAR